MASRLESLNSSASSSSTTGSEHKPNNLKLIGAVCFFKCVLNELNLEYTLFRADGTPLRASATAKFVGYVEDELRLAQERRQSPDVTHVRVVVTAKNSRTMWSRSTTIPDSISR
jgi:hypothetical protein